MSVLRFLLALAGAVVVHTLGVRTHPGFAVYVDVFLLLTLAWSFESRTLEGLGVGLVAGLTADAFTGAPYGLNGFADTFIGYSAAFAVGHLAKMSTTGAVLLYSVAAVVQQILLVALVILLIPNGMPPPVAAVVIKVAITGLLGFLVFRGRLKLIRTLGQWKQARESRLRF
jgi:rod shape-determining protein MreD